MAAVALSELLGIVQEELFIFSTTLAFRLGDSTDARNIETPVSSVSLTRTINRAIKELVRETGYSQQTQVVALNNGIREYAIPTDWLDVVSVHIGGKALRKTTLPGLDNRDYDWRRLAAAFPGAFYLNGTTAIGFDRAIDAATAATYTTASALVVRDVTTLTLLADVPQYLPTLFGDLPALRAAIMCANMDAGNPKAYERKKFLETEEAKQIASLKALMQARMTSDTQSAQSLRKAETK